MAFFLSGSFDLLQSLHFVLRVVMGLTQVQKQKRVWAELKAIKELLTLKTAVRSLVFNSIFLVVVSKGEL